MIEAKHGKLKSDEPKESEDDAARKVQLTDDMIVSQALLFLLAGFDTIEGLLNFALYDLALHPEIQETLYKELKASSEKEGGLNYETINSLEYLNMVISGTSKKTACLQLPSVLLPFMCFFVYVHRGASEESDCDSTHTYLYEAIPNPRVRVGHTKGYSNHFPNLQHRKFHFVIQLQAICVC